MIYLYSYLFPTKLVILIVVDFLENVRSGGRISYINQFHIED